MAIPRRRGIRDPRMGRLVQQTTARTYWQRPPSGDRKTTLHFARPGSGGPATYANRSTTDPERLILPIFKFLYYPKIAEILDHE